MEQMKKRRKNEPTRGTMKKNISMKQTHKHNN